MNPRRRRHNRLRRKERKLAPYRFRELALRIERATMRMRVTMAAWQHFGESQARMMTKLLLEGKL